MVFNFFVVIVVVDFKMLKHTKEFAKLYFKRDIFKLKLTFINMYIDLDCAQIRILHFILF